MKKFTKIAIIVASVLLCVGLVSVIGSFAMGLTWDSLGDMVEQGKFSFDIDDVKSDEKHIDEGKVNVPANQGQDDTQQNSVQSQEKEDEGFVAVQERFQSLDVEMGYGILNVEYGDVDKLQVKQENVNKYRCYVEEGTLHIEGNTGTNISIGKQDSKITIIVPANTIFDEADFEIGAGIADVSGVKANQVDIEVGAGEMNIVGLDTKELNAETGAGKLIAELVGKQTDYSYNLECGIGELKIGENVYSGLGTEQRISNPGAERFAEIECGIGGIEIKFQQ